MKTTLSKMLLLLSLSAFATPAWAVKDLRDDQVRVGVKSSSADKVIVFDTNQGAANPKIKANKSTNKLQFSQDGTNFKDIGSGAGSGGGGLNLLSEGNANADAEQGTTGHTASGGTFTTVAASPLQPNDTKHFRFSPSAANQTVTTSQVAITERLYGGNCSAQIVYKTTESTNLYKYQVINGSSVVQGSAVSLPATNGLFVRSPLITFPCPTSGTLAGQMVAASSAPSAAIDYDEEYVGELSTVQIVRQGFVGSISWAPAASCLWSRNTAGYANYAANTSCATPTVEGAVSAPATKIPALVLASGLPAGRYYIVGMGNFNQVNSVSTQTFARFRFSDGTTASKDIGITQIMALGTGGVSISGDGVLVGELNYTTAQAGPLTINLQSDPISASVTTQVDSINNSTTFSIYRYSNTTDTVYNAETLNFKIDASIGGDNPSLGGSAVSTPGEFTAAAFTLVANAGSSAVKIACPSTEAASGTTCATNEVPGVVFDAPVAGVYEACYTLTHQSYVNAGSSTALGVAWYLVETADGSSTILQTGKDVPFSRGSTNLDTTFPVRSCSDFTFSSSGKKALKIYRAQSAVAGTNSLLADRDASLGGGRDIHITVRLKNQFTTVPFTINAITSKYPGIAGGDWASVANSGTATIVSQSGFLSGVSRTGAGLVTNTFATPYAVAPICFCQSNAGNGEIFYTNSVTTSSVVCGNTATATDRPYNLLCFGPR
jgi:hypothetical protein